MFNSFESINEGGEESYNGKTHNYKHVLNEIFNETKELKIVPNKCPKCGSDDISANSSEMEKSDTELSDLIECQTCHIEWYEVYKFSNIEIIGE